MTNQHTDTVTELRRRPCGQHPFDQMVDEAGTAARYVDQAKLLADVCARAAELGEILAKEASGVRDGDGYWHGSDATHHALHELEPRLHTLAALYREAVRIQAPVDDAMSF